MDTVGIDDTEAVRQLNLPVVDIGI